MSAAILTLNGVSFWLAFPLAGLIAGGIGALLALPALRATGPYLAMITIAFAFIVQHVTIEWKALTGGQNGLMGLMPPTLGGQRSPSARWRCLRPCWPVVSLYLFQRLAASAWGKAMVAVRDSETAARSIGLNPVVDQDCGICRVGGVRGPGGRDLRAADDVRCAGLVSVLAVDPVPAGGHRRRRRLGVRTGGRRGR